MKNTLKLILTAALYLTAAVSCRKELTSIKSQMTVPPGEPCDMTVSVAVGTKASVLNDTKVSDLQIFVFRGDVIDGYGHAQNAGTLTLSCTSGDRTVYALVNGPDYSTVNSKTQLLAKVMDYSNHSDQVFAMVGSKPVTLPGSYSTSTPVEIQVERLMSRIVVHSITRDFSSAALESAQFRIDSIYVLNSASGVTLGKTPSQNYLNTGGKYVSGNADKFLLQTYPNKTITDGATDNTEQNLYIFPNNGGQATRLVIVATIGGRANPYYYPIEIPATIGCNTSYEFTNIKIKSPGTDSPMDNVSVSAIGFSVQIKDWVVVTEETHEIG